MNNMSAIFTYFILWIVSFSSCESGSNVDTIQNTENATKEVWVNPTPLDKIIEEHNIKIDELSILVEKSIYVLSVIHKDTIVKQFPIVLGYNPIGDKMQEGDYKTPEGTFGMVSKYAHANWKYFIWIDYPNEESWKRFKERKANGTIDKNAKIGGEIGIHGTPEGMDYWITQKENWTFGCVSLSRDHIAEIYPVFHKKIKITIVK